MSLQNYSQETNMEFKEFVEEFITACDFIDVPELHASTKFEDIEEFDSLAMLGVIVMLETKFGITATGDQIRSQGTLDGLYKFAVKK
jgi:acyl carrier protein